MTGRVGRATVSILLEVPAPSSNSTDSATSTYESFRTLTKFLSTHDRLGLVMFLFSFARYGAAHPCSGTGLCSGAPLRKYDFSNIFKNMKILSIDFFNFQILTRNYNILGILVKNKKLLIFSEKMLNFTISIFF